MSAGTSIVVRALTAAAVALVLCSAPVGAAASPAPSSGTAAPDGMDGGRWSSPTRAEGTFEVHLDPSTITATPVAGGAMCRLGVGAELVLAGTIDGTATGTTVAVIHAPCDAATSTPPGTYGDTFRFTGTFAGEVAGTTSTGTIEYAGSTRPGGEVSALLGLRGSATALAVARAGAGVGGTYRGWLQAP